MILRYTLAWMPMVAIAILNAIMREAGYKKAVGELRAHQMSTFTGILLFGAYIWFLNRLWPIESAGQAWIIGLIWLALTVAFEFLFGHYVMKNPWSKLLHDYDLREGRLWILVLVFIAVAPSIVYRLGQ